LGIPQEGLTLALIELDLDAAPAPPPGPPPARYVRSLAVVVTGVLVLSLGGAAPAAALLWQRVGLAQLGGASTSFQLVGGVLYTLDGNADRRTTTAWSLQPLRRLWSQSTALQLDASGTVIHDEPVDLVLAGGNLLQRSPGATTVLDPRTGRVRWRTDTPLLTGSGSTGLRQESTFAPGTVYDESSGDPGPLYFSIDGVPHTQPPERTVLRGLDLTTGRERWRYTESGSVYAVPGAGGFVVVSADRITLLSAETGAVLRYRSLPRITGDSYPDVVGDLVLLAYGGTIRALSRSTFAELWRHPDAAGATDEGSCLGLLCTVERNGITVLDPSTGDPSWRARADSLLVARGPDVLEEWPEGERPIRVRDAGTGRPRVELSGWEGVADSDPGEPLLLFRAQQGSGRAGFAVLTPGADRVQPLGLTSEPVRACSSDDRYVACRIGDGVEVWAYRP
jgi:hypothetical protein